MRKLCGSLALAVMMAVAGCVAHVDSHHGSSGHPHGAPPGQAKKVVVVEASHFCVDSCDHFYLDGVWYIETGHKHGYNCGHYLVNGKWGKHKGGGDDDKDKKDKKHKKEKKDKDGD